MARVCLGFGYLALLLMCGCGDKKASVAGRVTLDGEPLEAGSISFHPIEGTQSVSAGATISKGEYQVSKDKSPSPGVFQVEIHAQRKTGRRIQAGSPAPPGTMVDEAVEAVPEKYNKASSLRFEAKAGNNVGNFDLVSK